ncbi:hypothetical protein NUW54_g10521 [Trametes sanguinea]|uniref:Uncharacterized protein n=1 Tax=Trametes sanguinea TaxID=158606 RepID=A0ACC1NZB2_9APHY|nr:hypothetical protein NUW54_g10521 [Trametes sanguinea]
MVSTSLLRDFDQTARSLGITPRLNEDGELVPIGVPEDKDFIYVVWVGRGIGLFYNWGLTLAMTCGFPGAAHKKYRGLESARQGWVQGPTRMGGTWRIPRPRASARASPRARPSSPSAPRTSARRSRTAARTSSSTTWSRSRSPPRGEGENMRLKFTIKPKPAEQAQTQAQEQVQQFQLQAPRSPSSQQSSHPARAAPRSLLPRGHRGPVSGVASYTLAVRSALAR